jgi:hypothetical protein
VSKLYKYGTLGKAPRESSVERQWGKTKGKEKDEDIGKRKKKIMRRHRGKK